MGYSDRFRDYVERQIGKVIVRLKKRDIESIKRHRKYFQESNKDMKIIGVDPALIRAGQEVCYKENQRRKKLKDMV